MEVMVLRVGLELHTRRYWMENFYIIILENIQYDPDDIEQSNQRYCQYCQQ